MKEWRGFATKAVHGGEDRKFGFDPASTPIYQTSTFFFQDTKEAEDITGGSKEGFIYTRLGNPTVNAFEEKMALLEGGASAVAFSSGMGAISAVFFEILKPGDEVISGSEIYHGTRLFFDVVLKKIGCEVRYFDPCSDPGKSIPPLISDRTKLIFFETPSNPELSVIDIGSIVRIAGQRNLLSVVDNTFATPYLQRPLTYGIDCVVHSATKYIGGHGDAIGGVVVSDGEFAARLRQHMLMNLGACLSPLNAWLFIRGLKTLHVRMDRHCATATEIAAFLKGHPRVRAALFPGLKDHPCFDIAKRQMSDFGGMVSMRLESRETCRRFLDRLVLCRNGVSLGDVGTIVVNFALMFHSDLSDSACRKIGVDPCLIRISTGLEDASDIIDDIKQALDSL
jgi:methionine-gamma-lyase